ncbi:MAG: hypothetical protein CVU57_15380 [Deltaproteobacteria bacterium HGW-Deltaproteobacteria-15]|jgi:membrane-bound ClpP family serine protease|nr:MAG: hypothetical protein CVU57_15380 [Deltaproteobacteria bacterium HGW-Deltaproteobacteria-15]
MFSQYNGVEVFFLICAVIGGFFVLLKLIAQFMGMDHDVDTHMDMGGHDIDAHHSDSDVGFRALSLQGITSFLMMFGLVGLALHHESGVGTLIAVIGGTAAGLLCIWVMGKLFAMIAGLKSSGTITIDNTVGAQGEVYTNIPENGNGRVLIKVHSSLREYDAMSNDKKGIKTGTPVRVVWVDGNVLVVESI